MQSICGLCRNTDGYHSIQCSQLTEAKKQTDFLKLQSLYVGRLEKDLGDAVDLIRATADLLDYRTQGRVRAELTELHRTNQILRHFVFDAAQRCDQVYQTLQSVTPGDDKGFATAIGKIDDITSHIRNFLLTPVELEQEVYQENVIKAADVLASNVKAYQETGNETGVTGFGFDEALANFQKIRATKL